MNLEAQLRTLEAKTEALRAQIIREERAAKRRDKVLRALPQKLGLNTIPELIAALRRLEPKNVKNAYRKPVRLAPDRKKKLVAEAMKPDADRKALAKTYGVSPNSINVWVSQARRQSK